MLNSILYKHSIESVTEFFISVLLTEQVLQKMTKHNRFEKFSGDDYQVNDIATVFAGFFAIDLYSLKHRLFNGGWSKVFSREVFERGDAAVLIPYDPKTDQVVLIEQFRIGAIRTEKSPWLLEFIAGMFDADESPIEVCIREAKEEANLDIDKNQVRHVHDFLSSPGGTTEKLYMYAALIDSSSVVDGEVAGLDSENEDIKIHLVSLKQALEWLKQGKINNATTIIGLQWLALNYQALQADL